jgi:hypothetical protein
MQPHPIQTIIHGAIAGAGFAAFPALIHSTIKGTNAYQIRNKSISPDEKDKLTKEDLLRNIKYMTAGAIAGGIGGHFSHKYIKKVLEESIDRMRSYAQKDKKFWEDMQQKRHTHDKFWEDLDKHKKETEYWDKYDWSQHAYQSQPPRSSTQDTLKKYFGQTFKKHSDFKAFKRQQSMKLHPDRGGKTSDMAKFNDAVDQVEKSHDWQEFQKTGCLSKVAYYHRIR